MMDDLGTRGAAGQSMADRYASVALARLTHMLVSQRAQIDEAGAAVSNAIGNGHRVWVTQTSHTLHTEATRRAGGLMAVHALDDPSDIESGDVLIAGTTAGVFESIVEAASVAKRRGATVVALIQLAHESDPALHAEHPSGLLLHEIADIVIDLGGRLGDGEIDLPGTGIAILPSSGVTGVMALWMLFAVAVEALLVEGRRPLVYQSQLQVGAPEGNAERLSRYVATRIGYDEGIPS